MYVLCVLGHLYLSDAGVYVLPTIATNHLEICYHTICSLDM